MTVDRLWVWNGTRWRTTVTLEDKGPQQILDALGDLAEDLFAEAGEILAARPAEWEPRADLRDLVALAEGVGVRIQQVQQAMAARRRHTTASHGLEETELRELERDLAALRTRHRAVLTPIGRLAPASSVKEADDIREGARILEERRDALHTALAHREDAERKQVEAVMTARKDLLAAVNDRLAAIGRARQAVEHADVAHASAVGKARARIRSFATVGAGELKAVLQSVRLHANVLETPGHRLPLADLTALSGTASELWLEHRSLLTDLVDMGGPEAEAFVSGLLNGDDTMFVVFRTRVGTVLWCGPASQNQAANRFLKAVEDQARAAAADREERLASIRRAEEELQATLADRSRIDAAARELEHVERDARLLAGVKSAHQRLERAEQQSRQLLEAQERVDQILAQILTPPDSLPPRRGVTP